MWPAGRVLDAPDQWRIQPKISGEGQNFMGWSSGAPRIRQGGAQPGVWGRSPGLKKIFFQITVKLNQNPTRLNEIILEKLNKLIFVDLPLT